MFKSLIVLSSLHFGIIAQNSRKQLQSRCKMFKYSLRDVINLIFLFLYFFFFLLHSYDSKLTIFRMRTFCIAFNILVLSLTSFIATIVLRSIIVFLLPLKLLRFFHKTFSQILDIFHRLKPYTHTCTFV